MFDPAFRTCCLPGHRISWVSRKNSSVAHRPATVPNILKHAAVSPWLNRKITTERNLKSHARRWTCTRQWLGRCGF